MTTSSEATSIIYLAFAGAIAAFLSVLGQLLELVCVYTPGRSLSLLCAVIMLCANIASLFKIRIKANA